MFELEYCFSFPVFLTFECQSRFEAHVRRTAACDIDAASPWKLAERVADQLLDEALGRVARDLATACDVVVDSLVVSETAE